MDDIELKRVVLFIVFSERESAQLLQYTVIVRIVFCIIQGLDAGNILVVQCHVRIAGKQSFPVFAIQFCILCSSMSWDSSRYRSL